jgi:hypothetical protein
MRIVHCLATILLSLIALNVHAQPQATASEHTTTISLNDIVVKATPAGIFKNKPRVSRVTFVFPDSCVYNSEYWDSTCLLTRFLSPTSKKFKLSSVEGRIADLDTSKLNLYLVILQFNGTDTLLKEVKITLGPQKRKRQRHLMYVGDSGIILQHTPFYLGYSFHTKPVPDDFLYRLYCTSGGEGAMLKRRGGTWRFYTNSALPYILPFSITYLEQ